MTATAESPSPFSPGAAAAPCTRTPGCVKGAGHTGFCSTKPAEQRENHSRKRGPRPSRKGVPGKRASTPAGAAVAPSAPARPSRATPAPARSSGMTPVLAAIWAGIGQAIEAWAPEPQGPPVGRVMQFQAPYAAEKLHPVLRKVPAYKALDEAAGGVMDELGPVLLAPILAFAMASNESMQGALWPMLSSQLEVFAVAQAKEKQRAAKALRELEGVSAEVDQLVAGLGEVLFAPRPQAWDGHADEQHVPGQGAPVFDVLEGDDLPRPAAH